jgi:hypothetical protein
MLPAHRTECYPHHLANLIGYADTGIKNIVAFATDLQTDSDALPDELKPISQALSDFTLRLLIEFYAEHLSFISERAYQEITRAGIPPTPQAEPDLIEKEQ